MMTVHVLPSVTLTGETSPAFLVVSGRAAALFAVLAGVGLALATGGPRPLQGPALQAARWGVAARAPVLLLVGLLLGDLDSGVAVILAYYAVLFLLALPFLGWRPRALAWTALAIAVVVPVLSQAVRPYLPPPSYGNPTLESLGTPVRLLLELTLTGYYPALPWMAYVLAGLAVGRLPLRQMSTAAWLLAGGVALAVAAWVLSWLLLNPLGGRTALESATPAADLFGRDLDVALTTSLYGTTPTTTWWWLAVAGPHSSAPLDLLLTTGTSLAVLGVALLLLPRPRLPAIPLIAAGSMTLSLYTLHVVLLATVLPRDVPYVLGWHMVIALAVATVWRNVVGRGPLEALTARVSGAVRDSVAPRTPT